MQVVHYNQKKELYLNIVLLLVHLAGGSIELVHPSGCGTSDESGCSSRKRTRKDSGGSFFDLNLPAELIDRN
ncbi:hypothetical protein KY290_003231 [Solanum tuberosum]|uniref:Protein ariadne-1 n=3 Tax=Solanum TaxID=4107 RepID=M1CCZ7_SOLTU|nr:hypothetical protein KY290_003231 [Solanum tuberosum]